MNNSTSISDWIVDIPRWMLFTFIILPWFLCGLCTCIFAHAYRYIGIYICVCVYSHGYVYVSVWAPKVHFGCLSPLLSTLFLDRASHWTWAEPLTEPFAGLTGRWAIFRTHSSKPLPSSSLVLELKTQVPLYPACMWVLRFWTLIFRSYRRHCCTN